MASITVSKAGTTRVASENFIHGSDARSRIRTWLRLMIAIAVPFVRMLCDCFKSRRRLEAEILVLRHQLNVLQQRAPPRLHLRWADHLCSSGSIVAALAFLMP